MNSYQIYRHAFRLLFATNSEWESIHNKEVGTKSLLFHLILPMVLLLTICNFLGYRFFDTKVSLHLQMHIFTSVSTFIFSILTIFLSAYLLSFFAVWPTKSKRFQKAFTLTAFSFFPGLIFNSLAFLLPNLNYLTILGLFSFYILYHGITPILNIPSEKKSGYFTFILIGLLSLYAAMGAFFIGFTSLFGF
ncbi:Yip1 family protein [Ancylomarina longa]|uniref:DUF1282 domain-containing protein n=1 Tax=Ancylomarina longa TaxID=2487017 RepID=A0A434AVN7_9BACT|nr:DUF1282 domain-containing protein [Ancylomarina longa]